MIHDENKSTTITSGTLLQHIHETKIDTIFRFSFNWQIWHQKCIFRGCHQKKNL